MYQDAEQPLAAENPPPSGTIRTSARHLAGPTLLATALLPAIRLATLLAAALLSAVWLAALLAATLLATALLSAIWLTTLLPSTLLTIFLSISHDNAPFWLYSNSPNKLVTKSL